MAADEEAWERRVKPALERLEDFEDRLHAQLDQINGGFGWWSGYFDWKTSALLADYLFQSVSGVRNSLLQASLAAYEHRRLCHAASHDFKTAGERYRSAVPARQRTRDGALRAVIRNDGHFRRRELSIESNAEGCFFHLGQALDRLAVALLIVGAFGRDDVARADWKWVATPASQLHFAQPDPTGAASSAAHYDGRVGGKARKGRTSKLGIEEISADPAGRQLQSDLLKPVANSDAFGEAGWLLWLRESRNAMTHRSPGVRMNIVARDGSLFRVFYQHPTLSEVQTLVGSSRNRHKHDKRLGPFGGAFLMHPTQDVLDGICGSTVALVAELADRMFACWDARASNPRILAQPARQWKNITPGTPRNVFQGSGNPIDFRADSIVLNPRDSARWEAARLRDDRVRDWFV